jgi:hypothetical protein
MTVAILHGGCADSSCTNYPLRTSRCVTGAVDRWWRSGGVSLVASGSQAGPWRSFDESDRCKNTWRGRLGYRFRPVCWDGAAYVAPPPSGVVPEQARPNPLTEGLLADRSTGRTRELSPASRPGGPQICHRVPAARPNRRVVWFFVASSGSVTIIRLCAAPPRRVPGSPLRGDCEIDRFQGGRHETVLCERADLGDIPHR